MLYNTQSDNSSYSEIQEKITMLSIQFYTEQKSIMENGRMKALQILQFLENSVEKAGREVDGLF